MPRYRAALPVVEQSGQQVFNFRANFHEISRPRSSYFGTPSTKAITCRRCSCQFLNMRLRRFLQDTCKKSIGAMRLRVEIQKSFAFNRNPILLQHFAATDWPKFGVIGEKVLDDLSIFPG